jgi:anti-sigma factor RsiW
MKTKSNRRPDEVVGPQGERVTRLSTVQLLREIASQGGLLVKKQIALAKSELKSDARTEAKVAGGLGLAAVGAIITVTLLLVTVAFALALVLPAWAAGLIVSGVVAVFVGVLAGVSWSRRIRKPLQRSRDELKQDVRFTKERFA